MSFLTFYIIQIGCNLHKRHYPWCISLHPATNGNVEPFGLKLKSRAGGERLGRLVQLQRLKLNVFNIFLIVDILYIYFLPKPKRRQPPPAVSTNVNTTKSYRGPTSIQQVCSLKNVWLYICVTRCNVLTVSVSLFEMIRVDPTRVCLDGLYRALLFPPNVTTPHTRSVASCSLRDFTLA